MSKRKPVGFDNLMQTLAEAESVAKELSEFDSCGASFESLFDKTTGDVLVVMDLASATNLLKYFTSTVKPKVPSIKDFKEDYVHG